VLFVVLRVRYCATPARVKIVIEPVEVRQKDLTLLKLTFKTLKLMTDRCFERSDFNYLTRVLNFVLRRLFSHFISREITP
jgi:hypothetical protein